MHHFNTKPELMKALRLYKNGFRSLGTKKFDALPENSFDFVSALNVIDVVPYPNAFLQRLVSDFMKKS